MGTEEPRDLAEPEEIVSTKQRRIAENARRLPEVSFSSIAHHMDVWWLHEAYRRTRKDGAVGIDGQTAEEYQRDLKGNLESLKERAKSGLYRAPAVRRVRIPKAGSTETRPIGIPTFEDKVLQRAVVMLMEPIYEQDFHDFSFGFRPGKSQHMALRYLRNGLMENKGGWVIDLDIRKFFDTLDRSKLREILAKRVSDGVIRRLIGKWLNAGVMENGERSHSETGTPQGGVISPLLSNIYLHEVLDTWFVKDVQPRMRGRCFLVRFADDAVLGFEYKADAERVMAVISKRFEKYGLELHPEKTKLVDMRSPYDDNGMNQGGTDPGSTTFLGFKHYWAKSRKGSWVIKQMTDSTRLNRAVQAVAEWIKRHRHESMRKQQEALNLKMKGHYGYYGVTGNFRSLESYYYAILRNWFKWLRRRSREKTLTWVRFFQHLDRFPLPRPRIVHSIYA
jgi:group II intron reverse transcriptase/maturase